MHASGLHWIFFVQISPFFPMVSEEEIPTELVDVNEEELELVPSEELTMLNDEEEYDEYVVPLTIPRNVERDTTPVAPRSAAKKTTETTMSVMSCDRWCMHSSFSSSHHSASAWGISRRKRPHTEVGI